MRDRHLTIEALLDVVDGGLPHGIQLAHLARCRHCADRLGRLRRQLHQLQELAESADAGRSDRRGAGTLPPAPSAWTGPSCLRRIARHARRAWRQTAREYVLVRCREVPELARRLGGPAAGDDSERLARRLEALGSRLGSLEGRPGPRGPPRSGSVPGLLRWLRRVDGRGGWWRLIEAAWLSQLGRRAAAALRARRLLAESSFHRGTADAEWLAGARGLSRRPGRGPAATSGDDTAVLAASAPGRGATTSAAGPGGQASSDGVEPDRGARRPAAPRHPGVRGHDGQWPTAAPSLRDSLAPR